VIKTWTYPSDLSDNINPDGKFGRNPRVAMDDNGNAIVTWEQEDGTFPQIFKSEYRNGAWTHPGDLSDNISPDGQYALYPDVAMDDNGNAIITWEQNDVNYNRQIFMSEYRNGAWTHPGDLNEKISPDGGEAYDPHVAMDDNGNAIITWRQNDGSNEQIFISEYRNGAWTHPGDLSDKISPDGGDAREPDVAMDNNGNAIITWEQDDGNNNQIFISEYRNGAWTHPGDLSDNISVDGVFARYADVAMDDNGNAIITWEQSAAIFKSEYRNGAWTHPVDLNDKIFPDAIQAWDSHVAMDNNGNAIITWEQDDGSNKQIFKSEYRNGAWTHPGDLNDKISPDGGEAYDPDVAMDNNGNAIITWEQDDGSNKQIFKSEYRNGAWTHPGDLSDKISPDGGDVYEPDVAMDDNGNAIITWDQDDGNPLNNQVYMSEYR
jgi:hypothetical protein